MHRVFGEPSLGRDPGLAGLGAGVPWVMMVHRPGPELFADLSAANLQAIRILQAQEGLASRLDSLSGGGEPRP